MNAAVDRQRWLGVLALALAVPLPLTGVVSAPFLLPFVAVAGWLVFARRPLEPLPLWAENLLAPVILVLVVVAGGMRYGILRPVTQLAVALATVRLLGCGERRRARRTVSLLALVGVAGIASSTHPLLAAYLAGLLALVVTLVGHFTMLDTARHNGTRPRRLWPSARAVAVTVALSVVVAAPLFVVLPRLRSPFAASPFGGRPVSGFRDAVALHRIGDLKLSTSAALRVRFSSGEATDPDWLRLAGSTLQRYRNGVWAQARMRRNRLSAGSERVVRLTEAPRGARRVWAEITLEKASESLFTPLGAVAIALPEGAPVWRTPAGDLQIPRNVDLPLSYEVEFVPGRVFSSPPSQEDLQIARGSTRISELAEDVTRGARTPVAAALAVESYLRRSFTYTTSTYAPMREDPVEWFLFSSQSGHCEFFASSMVMLLRAVGIPARMQAGYAGAESTSDNEYLVRDNNAHAWVIAWIPPSWETLRSLNRRLPTGGPAGIAQGRWELFDPTPAEGRPVLSAGGRGWRMRFSWQMVESLWDRWVLTFSLIDQLDLVSKIVTGVRLAGMWIVSAAVALGLVLLAGRSRRRASREVRRPRWMRSAEPISKALARVVEVVRQEDPLVRAGVTPRRLRERVTTTHPAAAAGVEWLVKQHERTIYAGLSRPGRAEVRRIAREVLRALKSRGEGRARSRERERRERGEEGRVR
jgi:transglutaminase-like putative cysteine protease